MIKVTIGMRPTGRPSRRRSMTKVVHCPCGTDVSGETDDEIVANVEQHVADEHPDKVGSMSREEILASAHEH
jgi:hypothetical protein